MPPLIWVLQALAEEVEHSSQALEEAVEVVVVAYLPAEGVFGAAL